MAPPTPSPPCSVHARHGGRRAELRGLGAPRRLPGSRRSSRDLPETPPYYPTIVSTPGLPPVYPSHARIHAHCPVALSPAPRLSLSRYAARLARRGEEMVAYQNPSAPCLPTPPPSPSPRPVDRTHRGKDACVPLSHLGPEAFSHNFPARGGSVIGPIKRVPPRSVR